MADEIEPILDAQVDLPDARDLIYRPGLGAIRPYRDPRVEGPWWNESRVRDQGSDPSCTGHAVACAIDHLLAIDRLGSPEAEGLEPTLDELDRPYASAIMLYGNARLHDEWDGEGYSGSSLRGAIKGFRHNGVCSTKHARALLATYHSMRLHKLEAAWRWHMNADIGESASKVLLGAYYRVRPLLTDMHCALNEAELLVATARIHPGWFAPRDGAIPFDSAARSDPRFHAFVIVGYTKAGFIIQNSWGLGWGSKGCAIWHYEDWARNVADTWVMRLAAPFRDVGSYSVAPQGVSAITRHRDDGHSASGPIRLDVLGHLLPIVKGRLERHGTYQHDPETVEETIGIILRRQSEEAFKRNGRRFAEGVEPGKVPPIPKEDFKYRHVLLQVLAGGRTEDQAGRFVRGTQAVYKENGIYPIYLLWEAAFFTELRRQIDELIAEIHERTAAVGLEREALVARLVETKAGGLPARLRREIERSFRRFFYFADPNETPSTGASKPVAQTLRPANGVREMTQLFETLSGRHKSGSLSYHLAAHDLGARFVAEFLGGQFAMRGPHSPVFSTLHLIAPLIDQDMFRDDICPSLRRRGEGQVNRRARRAEPIVEQAWLWHLDRDAARRDLFNPKYPGDWPGLWSRILGGLTSREATETSDEQGNPTSVAHLHFDEKQKLHRTRSLAIEDFAVDAATEAAAHGRDLVRKPISGGRDDEPEPSHFGLDDRVSLLNEMLETILGKDSVARTFTELDVETSR